jgi:signal transduction histidine kinase
MGYIYSTLSKIGFLSRNYALKFLFIAFLGIHIPLLGAVAVIAWGSGSWTAIIITLVACTLIACAVTLYILKGLLAPLHGSEVALEKYLYEHELPQLPTQYTDEAGRLMQKIQITVHQLDGLIKEKEELAALFSHDIRTPLACIIGLSDMLQEKDDPDSINMLSKEINKLANEQLVFVQGILDRMVATSEVDTQFDPKPVMMHAVAEDVITLVNACSKAKEITIRNDIDASLVLQADAEQVKHVLINLLTNAIKFSYPRSLIHLWVNDGENTVRINIQDSGMGFKPGDEQGFFKMYTPQGRAGTAGEPSTGMGLYLSKKIMEKHGGTIKATSNGANKGSVFTMVFPSQYY